MGNSLKVAYDEPPPIGTRFNDAGFEYEVIAARPHTNQRGEPSAVITWRGRCAHDGEFFTFKTGARVYSFRRRCETHNAGWAPAVPFGSAPPPGHAAANAVSDRDVIHRFFNAWCEHYEDSLEGEAYAAAETAYELAADEAERQFPGLFDD